MGRYVTSPPLICKTGPIDFDILNLPVFKLFVSFLLTNCRWACDMLFVVFKHEYLIPHKMREVWKMHYDIMNMSRHVINFPGRLESWHGSAEQADSDETCRTRTGGWEFWLLPWHWHILPIPLKANSNSKGLYCHTKHHILHTDTMYNTVQFLNYTSPETDIVL